MHQIEENYIWISKKVLKYITSTKKYMCLDKLLISKKKEGKIIQLGIIIFWSIFWMLNFIDKIIPNEVYLWSGKDRMAQFVTYFNSIGLGQSFFPQTSYIIISLAELLAFILALLALISFLNKESKRCRSYLFWSFLTGLSIFSIFTIGDQVFGDRTELLEHSTYWLAIIISWFIYTINDLKK